MPDIGSLIRFLRMKDQMTDSLTDVERMLIRAQGSLPRRVFVVVGPSGVGKNTIIKEVLTNHAHEMSRVITYTTRPRREDEVEGEQYHFVSLDEFKTLSEQGRLLEKRDVYRNEEYYSLPADLYQDIASEHHLVIAEVDVNGMRLLRNLVPDCVTIFIMAHPAVLLQRIRSRRDQNLTEDNLSNRMDTAREQIRDSVQFDYMIYNEDGRLHQAVAALEAIIQAERMRVRQPETLQVWLLAELESAGRQLASTP